MEMNGHTVDSTINDLMAKRKQAEEQAKKDGQPVKEQPKSRIDAVMERIANRGFFRGFKRWGYNVSIDKELEIVKAIGKTRTANFTIDDENRFVYTNILKWIVGDSTMQAMNPFTKEIIPGRMKAGLYIAGNTGTGKSWLVEILGAYANVCGYQIQFDEEPQPLCWSAMNVNDVCDKFASDGNIQSIKQRRILAIQDLGREAEETLYMGNRINVMQQVIEYRGDRQDLLTIFTSNYPLAHQFTKEKYGDRITSRLNAMCNYYELTGKDRRI